MCESSKSVVFFDLDGTLTDPVVGITESIRHALRELGAPVPDASSLTWAIGPPLRESLAALVGAERSERAVALYRERFSEVGLFENEPYDGVLDVLGRLRCDGLRLIVASSKPVVYVERIAEHFGIARFLEAAFGAELDGARSDKTELLTYALSRTGIAASQCVMIGDRAHDGIGARNNEMPFIGVSYGYGSRDELADYATEIADSPMDIPAAVARTIG